MIRAFHRWPGLLALVLVSVLAASGAALSVFAVAERLAAPQPQPGLSVATLAGRVQAAYPGVEQIRRAPSGRITAYWFDQGRPGAAVIDPATGQGVAPADPNRAERWLINLHRALFLGDPGRLITAAGAAAMLVLAGTGAVMVARRAGGWRRCFGRLRGPVAGRLHVATARVTVIGLALSSLTALWMTASSLGLLPDAAPAARQSVAVSGQTGLAPAQMAALQRVAVAELRTLNFPAAGDASDVLRLRTDQGAGLVDQGTGALLGWADAGAWARLSDVVVMLHSGQGAAGLGLVLGLMALGVPVMGASGVLIWWAGRRGRPRIRANQPAGRADTIVLVGSEGGSSWGFAATLHAALSRAGHAVHVGAMVDFAPDRYARARRIIVLAATYGDGAAPASARGFTDRLAACDHAPRAPLAVLGFGDRSFPAYCAYARAVEAAAVAKGWPLLMPFDSVDRQSPQDFARWGRALGVAMGTPLALVHRPATPPTVPLRLIARRDYGAAVQAPAVILRFALPRVTAWQRLRRAGWARFQAGDLIGVLPHGDAVPRLYSLASSRGDGFVEIVVRRQPGGLCSGQLAALRPGDSVAAFLRPNPGFRAGRGRAPLILIGAGTGIGPLAGMVRANHRRRPVHLFFGIRDAASDFFYDDAMPRWQADGRLSGLVVAQSRGARPRHVQDALRAEAAPLAVLMRAGARVMVCGGRDMAAGVAAVLADVLAPVGMTPAGLKAEGRYVEDVY